MISLVMIIKHIKLSPPRMYMIVHNLVSTSVCNMYFVIGKAFLIMNECTALFLIFNIALFLERTI